ncbi:hypothetical protein [Streptomyces niveiscabiei]|uniref:Uncharacterized protein n=1 Tax=Streptomyces niveiscabiei TaxID=164115 RepID=A0ABW9HHZ7_9ACTN
MLADGDMAASAVARQAQVQALAAKYESFTGFRNRIDALIRTLKESPAGATQLGQDQVVRNQFGGGNSAWTEAAGLFTAYQSVITDLESLSKLLSDSMEGMSIAVLASHKGYDNVDLDVRQRMAAISAETRQHYDGEYVPDVPGSAPKTEAAPAAANETVGGL